MKPFETESPPPGVLVAGHFLEHFGYRVRRPGGSGNWLVTYTLAGGGLYRQPGVSIVTEVGDVVLLGPGAPHDYSVPEGGLWEFLWAHFQPRLEWHAWWTPQPLGDGLYLSRLGTQQVQNRVRQVFFGLRLDALSPSGLSRELALNGLEEILLLTMRESESSGGRAVDPRVRQALAVISEEISSRHTVASLATQLSLSPSRLSHLFKEEIGDSVMNTVLKLRLRQAARLLEHTGQSVGAIAQQTGFGSVYYLSRRFRRHFGVSPREYRASARRASNDRAADGASSRDNRKPSIHTK